jgi:hypothetical protein
LKGELFPMNRIARLVSLLAVGAWIAAAPQILSAQVTAAPALLNYQGRVATPDGFPVPDGTYSIRFSLWDAATAGTEKWNQTIANVQVKNGTFAVLLNANTANLFDGSLWLETKIGTDTALTPRQQLVSVAYAMKANSVPDGSIGANQIANNSITANKFANDALGWLLSGNNISNPATQFLGTTSNQPLVFRTNNTEKMRLLANGNLGIGTTSPVDLLTVVGNGTAISVIDNTVRTRFFSANGTGNGYIGTSSNHPLILRTGDADRAIIDTAGRMGIGTLSPANRLSVNGNADFFGNIAASTVGISSGTNKDAVNVTSSSTIGTWLNLANSSTGGRNWSILSAGSGNGEGAGTLVFNTQGVIAAQLKQTGEFIANVVTVVGGSDVAEPYNVAAVDGVKPAPGMLVIIDPNKVGQMRVASHAYDTTVAGIISGANGIRPGITLTQKGTVADGEFPVASIGRVWCWCDADANGAIKPGDLLTSSDTPGHAMKASDREKRDGAVIGKAMSALPNGKGLVLVLVSLK